MPLAMLQLRTVPNLTERAETAERFRLQTRRAAVHFGPLAGKLAGMPD